MKKMLWSWTHRNFSHKAAVKMIQMSKKIVELKDKQMEMVRRY